MIKPIVGSPEAMKHEPSLEPPEARTLKRGCDTSVELGDYIDAEWKRLTKREKRLEDSLTEPSEDDVFPKGIDDSIGG